MIKQVAISELRPGMYVHDLNCGWMEHPFLSSRFEIEDSATVDKIRALGMQHVLIDTGRGLDVRDAPTLHEVQQQRSDDLRKLAAAAPAAPAAQPLVSVREERRRARGIQLEARRLATGVLTDVRLGRQIEAERVNPVVGELIDSVFRNPDALVSLGRMRAVDQYTFEHSVGVCVLLAAFAKSLGLERSTIDKIGMGGILHDVGKMRVPDAILNKPGKLTDREFEIMRRHVEYTCELIGAVPELDPVSLAVAAEHHERFDGSGYPNRKKGEEITLYGQMAAIVDVYDAITAERCYHAAMQPTEALGRILEWSKFHFNPLLTQHFIQCVGIYPVGTLVLLESGRLAVVVAAGQGSLLEPVVRICYDTHERRPLPLRDLDLARRDETQADAIVRHEDPALWGIQPESLVDRGAD